MRKTAFYCMLKRLNNTIDIYSEKYKDVSVPDHDTLIYRIITYLKDGNK